MKNLFLIALLSFLSGCASIEVLAPPVDDLFITEAGVSEPKITQLREGRKVYLEFCTGCHQARQVDEITADNWKRHIPKMFRKAELYPDEIVTLTAYLKTAGPINQSLISKRP